MSKLLLGEVYREKLFGFVGILMSRTDHMYQGILVTISVPDKREPNDRKMYTLPLSRVERITPQPKMPAGEKRVTTRAGGRHNIKFGKEYVDIVDGVRGIAVQRTEHLTGCERLTLEYIKTDGEVMRTTMDESIVKQVAPPKKERKRTVAKKKKPGGPSTTTSLAM